MGIPIRLNLNGITTLNLFLTAFTLIGIFAFYKILEFFIKSLVSEKELITMTAVFAFQPAVLSSTIHLTLDTGVLLVFLCLVLAYLKERYWWAALIGIFLVFTKETGLLFTAIGADLRLYSVS